MFRVFLNIIIISVLVALAMWVLKNDGTLTIVWLGWEISTSVIFAIVLIIASFSFLYGVFEFLAGVISWPSGFLSNYFAKRNRKKLYFLIEAWEAYSVGDFRTANRLVKKIGRFYDMAKIDLIKYKLAEKDPDARAERIKILEQYPQYIEFVKLEKDRQFKS